MKEPNSSIEKSHEEVKRFLSSLNEEKLKAQERRGLLIASKIKWVTGLFALGAIKLPASIEATTPLCILYFVPAVSIIYDLYILGEDYGIKRMGRFVRKNLTGTLEAQWESSLKTRRDKYSWYALPISSGIVLTISALSIFLNSKGQYPELFAVWFTVLALLMAAMFVCAACSLKKLAGSEPKSEGVSQ